MDKAAKPAIHRLFTKKQHNHRTCYTETRDWCAIVTVQRHKLKCNNKIWVPQCLVFVRYESIFNFYICFAKSETKVQNYLYKVTLLVQYYLYFITLTIIHLRAIFSGTDILSYWGPCLFECFCLAIFSIDQQIIFQVHIVYVWINE